MSMSVRHTIKVYPNVLGKDAIEVDGGKIVTSPQELWNYLLDTTREDEKFMEAYSNAVEVAHALAADHTRAAAINTYFLNGGKIKHLDPSDQLKFIEAEKARKRAKRAKRVTVPVVNLSDF